MDRVRRMVRRGMFDALPFYTMLARRRGLTLCIAACVIFVLYSGPSMFRYIRRRAPLIMDSSLSSMVIQTEEFVRDSQRFDAHIYRSFEADTDVPIVPFVGNGYLGYDASNDKMYVFNDRTLSLEIPFSPAVRVDLQNQGGSHHESTVVHYVRGKVIKVDSHNLYKKTVTVQQQLMAHRLEQGVFIQSLVITNQGNEEVQVVLRQALATGKDTKQKNLGYQRSDHFEHIQYSGKVATDTAESKVIVFSLIVPKTDEQVVVAAKSMKTLELMTVVAYSKPVGLADVTSTMARMEDDVKTQFERLGPTPVSVQKRRHVDAWQNVWNSGLSISLSKAEGALNGDRINATLYYVLSNTPPSSQHQTDLLSLSKHCYKGHHTLGAAKLWPELSELGKADVMRKTISLWMLTLSKRGCNEMITKGGPVGVMQAMLLSFGAFSFHEGHLEFYTQPADLHRDFLYRNIILYSNDSKLNVSVTVNKDNKAMLGVKAIGRDKVFACDGGCLDPAVLISGLQNEVIFPVKKTHPPTAVLYIAQSERHLEELRHTLHVHEIAEAPAHEHHVIAMHKHGHQLGGLPALFWVSFAFLVVIFHLFLARIIYNEYFASGSKGSSYASDSKKYVA